MKPRPTSVTVIAWILIVVGCLALITTTFTLLLGNPAVKDLMARSPIPASVQYVMSYAGLAVMIASGAGMLKGQNWARLLYVIWTAVSILLGLVTSPVRMMLIPGVILYGVIVFFLFRPKATQYFTESEAPRGAESH